MKVKDKYLNFYYETIGEVPEPVIDPRKTALLISQILCQPPGGGALL